MRRGPTPPRDFNEYCTVTYDIETVVACEPSDGSFPPWPQHQVVAAAFLTATWSDTGYDFRLDTLMCKPGEEADFFRKVDELLPAHATGVTYAGRSFDNLVLSTQAMRWCPDLNLPGLARQATAERYSGVHCDLADQFAGRGATRPVPLVELCAALGIPAKINTSGGEVGALWRSGDYAAIREYVREDVIGTYLLWLHAIAFRRSDESLMMLPLAELAAWIETQPGLEHLKPFADCRPARLAKARAPALRAEAALADAQIRLARERDEQAFAPARPF